MPNQPDLRPADGAAAIRPLDSPVSDFGRKSLRVCKVHSSGAGDALQWTQRIYNTAGLCYSSGRYRTTLLRLEIVP